jgi:hypothetical protein
VHEHRLPALRPRSPVEQLVGSHIREDEAQNLRRVDVLGHLDRIRLKHTDALGVRAPDRQSADTVSHAQPRAARAELLDHADKLVARRERRLRHAEIRTDAEHGIGVRHAGGQHPDANLARSGTGNVVVDHRQDLGTAEVVHDHALHPVAMLRLHCDLPSLA